MPLEVTREVSLVAEADARRDLNDRLSLEETLTRRLDSTPEDVCVRCDAEGSAEAADEMRRACPETLAGSGKRHTVERVRLEEVAKPLSELVDAPGILGKTSVEMRPQALHDESQVSFGFECIVRVTKSPVQEVQATAQSNVLQARLVDGTSDQALAQHTRIEIQHPLAVAATRGRSPVVNDVRWKYADRRAARAAVVPVKVVPDLPFVDDEHVPRVVGMRRIRVLVELGVQHLADPRHRRPPGVDSLSRQST